MQSESTNRGRRFGHIVSVTGSQAIVALERNSYNPSAKSSDRVAIGSLVVIQTPISLVVGMVSETSSPMPEMGAESESIRLIELYLAGEIPRGESNTKLVFHRGVSNFPTIGDRVRECTSEELSCVYGRPNAPTIEIGTLFQDKSIPAPLLLDELLGKHFIVVGNTGTGKSCALKLILRQSLEGNDHAHILVLDMHNEYADVLGDKANLLNPGNLRLPFWLLNFQELCSVLTTDGPNRDAEVEILSDAIVFAKRNQIASMSGRGLRLGDGVTITVDTPTPYRLAEVLSYLTEQMGKLERTNSTLPYRKLKARIEALVSDARFSFMFGGLTVEDNMTELLGDLFRIPANGKPITLIDLSSIPWDVLDVVISLIARLAFDLGVWCKGKLPVLLVCEEAHRYAPASSDGGFIPTRGALARIAKEGRKYGISLGLVTQRPSELDPTIISQCSTVIAMRLSTERDQKVIDANSQDGGLEFLDFLPILGERQAIVLGQGAPMPMRVEFHDIGGSVSSAQSGRKFSVAWKDSSMGHKELEAVVSRWRDSGRTTGKSLETGQIGAVENSGAAKPYSQIRRSPLRSPE
jgi:DNA helicase HerA-like ATPase